MSGDVRRPGRPVGGSDARDRILATARDMFARSGANGTTIRAIAAAANVDPALVHHYFGSKAQLFAAAVDIPADPQQIIDALSAAPTDRLGHTVATVVLTVWESELGPRLKAVLRDALAGGSTGMIGAFLRDVVTQAVVPRIDDPVGTGIIRAEFAVTQILGVLMARHILELQPFAGLPLEQVIETIAPNVQHYFTGELPAVGGEPTTG